MDHSPEPEGPLTGGYATGETDISDQMVDDPAQLPEERTITITSARHDRGFYVHWQDPDGGIESLHVLRHFQITFIGRVADVEMAAASANDDVRGWIPTHLGPLDDDDTT